MTARLPLIVALALAASAAWAQRASDLAPESAPSPETRPAGADLPGPSADRAPEADEVAPPAPSEDGAVPRPETRPAEGATPAPPEEEPRAAGPAPQEPADADASPAGPAADVGPADPPMREVLAETPEALAACLAELDALGASYERAEPIEGEGNPGCGIANPLIVTGIAPEVALEPPSTMRCEAALAAARWVADTVVPMSRKLGRGDLVAIDQGTAYLCRPRADGKMSEHAWGNALDVMGFRFGGGDPIPVVPRAGDGTLEEAFQRAARAGACLDFATVLGPGSDADHANHLHLDVKAREGGYRVCE